MNINNVIEQLKIDEGFSGSPYLDTVGKTTIGYGRNLDDVPLSRCEAEYLLSNDVNVAKVKAERLTYFNDLNDARKEVVINMIFNLGYNGYKKFKKMEAAIIAEDYNMASMEMMDSKWASQVGARARRLSIRMRTGE